MFPKGRNPPFISVLKENRCSCGRWAQGRVFPGKGSRARLGMQGDHGEGIFQGSRTNDELRGLKCHLKDSGLDSVELQEGFQQRLYLQVYVVCVDC